MNKSDDLLEFLRNKAADGPLDLPQVNWDERKKYWLQHLDQLYASIKEWLKPLEEEKLVLYWIEKIQLTEKIIGSYEVDVLVMNIGNQLISFDPKGTLIVGAEGRVDVHGERSIGILILKDSQWLIAQRANRPLTVPFNKESFQDLLEKVMK
jgi:hypothetical protein